MRIAFSSCCTTIRIRTPWPAASRCAISCATQGVTRPENMRMANMLDIQVEPVTPASFTEFDRIATVDVQPHYFAGQLLRADLVIDHHPEQPGYIAVFK